MRLVRSQKEALVFNLTQVEQRVFREVLLLYPLVPASHQPLSKSIKGRRAIEDQHLLDEALASEQSLSFQLFDDCGARLWRLESGIFSAELVEPAVFGENETSLELVLAPFANVFGVAEGADHHESRSELRVDFFGLENWDWLPENRRKSGK